jgi:hypothetical protein
MSKMHCKLRITSHNSKCLSHFHSPEWLLDRSSLPDQYSFYKLRIFECALALCRCVRTGVKLKVNRSECYSTHVQTRVIPQAEHSNWFARADMSKWIYIRHAKNVKHACSFSRGCRRERYFQKRIYIICNSCTSGMQTREIDIAPLIVFVCRVESQCLRTRALS